MRNKNWTTIGIVVLIAGLVYYFFMQEWLHEMQQRITFRNGYVGRNCRV